jgi:hypothetical protein
MIIDYNAFKIVSYQTIRVSYHVYNIASKIYDHIYRIPLALIGF